MNRKARRAAAKKNGSNADFAEIKSYSLGFFDNGVLDWNRLIEENEELAIAVMLEVFEIIDGDTVLELLSKPTKGNFYGVFMTRLTAAVDLRELAHLNDPIWLEQLKTYALYEFYKNQTVSNIAATFLYVSLAGYYDEDSIKSTDYFGFAAAISKASVSSSWPSKRLVLDWLARNTDDRWLTDRRIRDYEEVINHPKYTHYFSPDGRLCMDKLKARWEYLKLTERHQMAMRRSNAVNSAL